MQSRYESHRGGMLLSNNRNVFALYQRLREREGNVHLYSRRLTGSQIQSISPRFVISYNYSRIVLSEILALLGNRIVNLHISYLPWNRGSDPNFWSFMEDTPKGVTIHHLSDGLDRGDILLQEEFYFDERVETFRTTYDALNDGIQRLFLENWDKIKNRVVVPQRQKGRGSYYKKEDLTVFLRGEAPDLDEIIYAYKKRKISGI